MESKLIELASAQGFYAVLFLSLFFYVLRDHKEREQNYRNVIDKLSDILNDKVKNVEQTLCVFKDKFDDICKK